MKQPRPRWMTELFPDDFSGPHPEYPEHMQRWHKLLSEYPYLRVLTDYTLHEPAMPKPLDRELFLALLGSLQYEPHRKVLAELLLDVLSKGLAAVLEAVAEGDE